MNDASSIPIGLPHPLVTGASAWVGPELAKRPSEWTYTLSAAEIEEIAAATASVRGVGLDIADIRRSDFPLPSIGTGA